MGYFLTIEGSSYEDFFKTFPLLISAVIFIFSYIFVTFFSWAAKDIFKLIGAYVFGAYVSTLLIWLGEMGNSFVFFHFSRYYGREFIQARFQKKNWALNRCMPQAGFLGLFIARVLPIVPFRVLDLAAGLTSMRFLKYFVIVAVASPVRIFWVQFILAGVGTTFLREPQELVNFLNQNPLAFSFSLFYFAISIIIIFVYQKKERLKNDRRCI